MIGNASTLLPDTPAPDTGKPYTIPSCWTTPPAFFEAPITGMAARGRDWRAARDMHAEFLCPEGRQPERTGSRLAFDAPYPEGHPLAERD